MPATKQQTNVSVVSLAKKNPVPKLPRPQRDVFFTIVRTAVSFWGHSRCIFFFLTYLPRVRPLNIVKNFSRKLCFLVRTRGFCGGKFCFSFRARVRCGSLRLPKRKFYVEQGSMLSPSKAFCTRKLWFFCRNKTRRVSVLIKKSQKLSVFLGWGEGGCSRNCQHTAVP